MPTFCARNNSSGRTASLALAAFAQIAVGNPVPASEKEKSKYDGI
jgi:hypothetical protein